MGRLPRALVRLSAAAARTRLASARASDRRRIAMSKEEVESIVVKVLESGKHRQNGYKYGGASSDGWSKRESLKNVFRVSSSLVMFGALWQYVDKSNRLTKEQIMTHMLLGQLEEEKKEREKEREEYLLKAKQHATSQRWKWFWFRD